MTTGIPDHETVVALTDAHRGSFRMHTESSAYLIKLTDTGHTLTRTPGAGLGPLPRMEGELPPPSELRSDEQPITLLHIERLVPEERAVLWILMPDGVPIPPGYLGTMRETTIVRAIERLDCKP